jgi:NAD(P)-dependent dehydrogenase (short-subunit alcohol dehydrogenase family)
MLRDELAPSGVRVYAIAPGFMPDGMNADIPKAFVQMIEAKVPDKKLAQASDIADKIQMLYDTPPENDVFVIPIAPEYGM